MWSDWLVFCDCGFQSVCPLMEKDKRLWKLPDGIDWLRGKLGLVLMGGAMLNKSSIQFSIDAWSCVPSLLFTWGQTMVEVMKIMATSFKSFHACTITLSDTNPAAGHHWPTPLLETPGYSWASLGQPLVGSLLLSPGSWCTGSVCALQESVSPVLCKSWQLYGGVNGNLLQEGLCHTQVCCTQSPCPCSSPLLTCTSTGDTQTQFCLSLCGVSGSWCTEGFFEPSEHLWREWGFILNVNLPILPSCWGFSDLGHGVSPHSHSSAMQPLLQHLMSCWGFSFALGHGVSPCKILMVEAKPGKTLPCWWARLKGGEKKIKSTTTTNNNKWKNLPYEFLSPKLILEKI